MTNRMRRSVCPIGGDGARLIQDQFIALRPDGAKLNGSAMPMVNGMRQARPCVQSSRMRLTGRVNFRLVSRGRHSAGLMRFLRRVVLAASVAAAPIAAYAMGDEEFVGPLSGWSNVKTVYGAVGNGTTDDTVAIQAGLDALGPGNPTLYFPAGAYKITSRLSLTAKMHVNLIGEDPATTTIIWGGSAGGRMVLVNGVAYSRIDRLTFDGQNAVVSIIGQAWDGTTGNFDTGNEYADDVFKNSTTNGFSCGWGGFGCAETSMLRDQFINITSNAITMGNFNALDLFVWDSFFQGVGTGVSNQFGAGNFHVYNSIFQNSTTADVTIETAGIYNFRNNYSSGSGQFIGPGIGNSNPANIMVQGNTILDTVQSQSIAVGNMGPVVVIDNIIRSLAPATSPVVEVSSFVASDLFSMGNTYTVASPVDANGHLHSVQDQVVGRGSINPSPPTLPSTPPNNHRQIFEVAAGSTTAQIQTAINNAVASATTRPVVHLQPGNYSIATTLVVPASSDVQIVGDGYWSRLVSSGAAPVLRLNSPSKATLREFSVNGNSNTVDGIEVVNVDQSGSRVFMEQATLSASTTNLFVESLDYTNVELHDFYHNYDAAVGATSIAVTGGPSAARGSWRGGATNIFAGASTANYISYGVSNGAHVSVQDIWYDNAAGANLVADVTGAGAFSYAGSTAYMPTISVPGISIHDFQGVAALVDINTNANVNVTGNGAGGAVLGLGLVGPSSAFFNNTTSPADSLVFLNGQSTGSPPMGQGAVELPEIGVADPAFLTAALNQERTTHPTLLAPLGAGITDVRIYRVFVDNARVGIHLTPGSGGPPVCR